MYHFPCFYQSTWRVILLDANSYNFQPAILTILTRNWWRGTFDEWNQFWRPRGGSTYRACIAYISATF